MYGKDMAWCVFDLVTVVEKRVTACLTALNGWCSHYWAAVQQDERAGKNTKKEI